MYRVSSSVVTEILLTITYILVQYIFKAHCLKRTSDFEEVSNLPTYIDSSLLIKEIFKTNAYIKLITAPRKFGKSTNLDMIKRFLEIQVDENGKAINIIERPNYKLFEQRNLSIWQHEQFIKTNFGQDPVIFIDYRPLKGLQALEDMAEAFSEIIHNTFLQHNYLLKNESLWSNDSGRSSFHLYHSIFALHRSKTQEQNQQIICGSFKLLAELLHKHFGKQVFVLIDDYNIFVHDQIFKDNSAFDDISKFFWKIESSLLESNEDVSGALLTGTLNVHRGQFESTFEEYEFLDTRSSIRISPFYSLTEADFDKYLNNTIPTLVAREKTKKSIDEYLGAYRMYDDYGGYDKLYSIWSVMNLLMKKNKTSSYLCSSRYLQEFKATFQVQDVSDEIQDLLSGREVFAELGVPLQKEHISALHNLIQFGNATSRLAIPSFCRLLYSLGYLTPDDTRGPYTIGRLIIPNKEIHDELKSYIQKAI